MILGHPITELFLYFTLYSFLGWVCESIYCSVPAGHIVPRGFLYGPVCPIYGFGATLVILFFEPLMGNLFLFYVVATVVMTAWEYFVGWLLEVTTHVKYWDYSRYRFNLKGRVCLWMALLWGVLSYIILYWVHPPVEKLYHRIPQQWIVPLCIGFAVIFLVDAVFTIRGLALMTKFTNAMAKAKEEMQLQLSLGKAELDSRREAAAASLRQRYLDSSARLEKYSRRYRRHYAGMSFSPRTRIRMEDLKAAADLAREELEKRRAAHKK